MYSNIHHKSRETVPLIRDVPVCLANSEGFLFPIRRSQPKYTYNSKSLQMGPGVKMKWDDKNGKSHDTLPLNNAVRKEGKEEKWEKYREWRITK